MEKLPWAERGQGPRFLVCCPGIMEELRSWVPGWLVRLPLTQAAPHPAPTLPSLPGTPALLSWPTPKGKQMNNDYHKKNKGAHKPKQLVEASSPIAHYPEPTAGWSYFAPGPRLTGPSSTPYWEEVTLVRTLTHTGLALAQADLPWYLWGPQGPWPLYPVPPATDHEGSQAQGCGNLGLGSRGYSHGTV